MKNKRSGKRRNEMPKQAVSVDSHVYWYDETKTSNDQAEGGYSTEPEEGFIYQACDSLGMAFSTFRPSDMASIIIQVTACKVLPSALLWHFSDRWAPCLERFFKLGRMDLDSSRAMLTFAVCHSADFENSRIAECIVANEISCRMVDPSQLHSLLQNVYQDGHVDGEVGDMITTLGRVKRQRDFENQLPIYPERQGSSQVKI